MAREKQYGDPISIPFSFGVKEQVVEISKRFHVSQADIIRSIVEDGGLEKYVDRATHAQEAQVQRNERVLASLRS